MIQKQEELRVCLEEAERVRDMERTEKESLRSSLRAATNAGKTLEEVDMYMYMDIVEHFIHSTCIKYKLNTYFNCSGE